MSMMSSMNKLFGKIAPGMCRLGMNGIAIKTSDGYKSYNVETGNLVNCAEFVFDAGDDMFFLIPTNVVRRGDIVMNNGKPVCVIEVNKKTITAMSYEDSTIITLVPQRHVFFGNTYFYSKIVSIFGDMTKGMSMEKIMPMMMMSEVCKGADSNNSGLSKMMPFMLMSGGGFNFGDMFSGVFNLDGTDNDDKSEEEN